MANDIILRTDVEVGRIINNFDEVKASIIAEVQPFQGLVFEDSDIGRAKETAAMLNKMVAAIEDKRKLTKKKWLEPYNEFEAKAKELVMVIEKPMDAIKDQISAYTERKRAEKREQVEAEIGSRLGELDASEQAYIRECGIGFNDRWLNATYSMSQIQKDVAEQIATIRKDVENLRGLCGDDGELLTALLDEYQRTKDMPAVFAAQKRIIARREAVKAMAEAKAAEEARLKAEAEAQEAAESTEEPVDESVPDEQADGPLQERERTPSRPSDGRVVVRFEVAGTLDEIRSIVAFMNRLGVENHRVK